VCEQVKHSTGTWGVPAGGLQIMRPLEVEPEPGACALADGDVADGELGTSKPLFALWCGLAGGARSR
jgi:hypothetical protein